MMEAILLALAICIDSFTLAVSYGIKKIQIPLHLLLVINLFSVIILAISIFFGYTLTQFISPFTATLLSSIILGILGILFILEGYLKHLAAVKYQKKKDNKLINFSIPKLGIMIEIALDSTKADLDISGNIDFKESIYIGILLSLDSLGAGFGYSIGENNIFYFLIIVFFINLFSLLGGLSLGKRIQNQKSKLKTSLLSGSILILLSILKWI